MGIRSWVTGIAIGVLLVLLCVQPAKADEFNFTFSGNQAVCTELGSTCSDFGSGTFTAGPPQNDILYRGYQPITGMTGTFDGSTAITFVPQGFPSINGSNLGTAPYYERVFFMAGGQEWALWWNDVGPTGYFLADWSSTNTPEAVNLTITAPEPATILLLLVGIGAMFLYVARRQQQSA